MSYPNPKSFILTAVLGLLLSPATLAVTHAYRSVGAHGEVSFSDMPSNTATAIELPGTPTAPTNSAEQVALMLQVADDLAEARHIRESKHRRNASRHYKR